MRCPAKARPGGRHRRPVQGLERDPGRGGERHGRVLHAGTERHDPPIPHRHACRAGARASGQVDQHRDGERADQEVGRVSRGERGEVRVRGDDGKVAGQQQRPERHPVTVHAIFVGMCSSPRFLRANNLIVAAVSRPGRTRGIYHWSWVSAARRSSARIAAAAETVCGSPTPSSARPAMTEPTALGPAAKR